ncbi:hypothetical protein AB0M36_08570 [Actinoplanes sp. NPDC051346]|uniref:hypothetical protein n=1 Tax=Actinoplanes sp. NPDC051346 TaxID=3155048 RepID=UPI00343307EB
MIMNSAGDSSGMSYGGMPDAQQRPRPRMVEIGASLLAIIGVSGVGRVAYGVLVNLSEDGWSSGARAIFLVLNSITLVFSVFLLVLADQVRRGRMWAWIVSLVMLSFTILFAGLALLITVVNGGFPLLGAGVVAASLGALLVLTVPRTVRGYILRKPVPAGPMRAGAAPGYPWGPGHPPA